MGTAHPCKLALQPTIFLLLLWDFGSYYEGQRASVCHVSGGGDAVPQADEGQLS